MTLIDGSLSNTEHKSGKWLQHRGAVNSAAALVEVTRLVFYTQFTHWIKTDFLHLKPFLKNSRELRPSLLPPVVEVNQS